MSDNPPEIKVAVDEMIGAFETFVERHGRRFEEQQRAIEALEVRANRPGLTNGPSNSNSFEAKAWANFLARGPERMDPYEAKSLIAGDDTRGGYLAPPEFTKEILKGIVQFSPIRGAARVGTTSAGSVLLPKRTSRPTATWIGELEVRPETGITYGQDEVRVDESACYIDVSQRLLEDSAIDLAKEIASDLAAEFGRQEAQSFIKGDGLKQPLGVLSTPGLPVYANGHVAVLNPDKIIEALYKLAPYYRNRSTWLMNGNTLAVVRTMREQVAAGAYLWQPSFIQGQPETFLGRPILECVDMPDVATNAYPIAVGDWETAFRIFDKPASYSLLRDPYSVATSGLVRFHARRRVGAQVVMPEALIALKMSVS